MILMFVMSVLILAITGCNKLVDVNTPQNQLTTDKIFTDTNSTKAALVNIYAYLEKSVNPNYNKYLDVYTDDFTYLSTGADGIAFNLGNIPSTNSVVKSFWSNSYFVIYSCNDIITQLKTSSNIPAGMVNSLTGEAKFLRAYTYFYLINSFGAVPLVLTTDVNNVANAMQTDSATVYAQIKQDLTDAQNVLTSSYTGTGKVRANKWAASALLSRVYLYQQDWNDAETSATNIINSGQYTPLATPASVFLANSQESILQFYTQNGFITDATSLIPTSGLPGYAATQNLLNSFETGDLRKASWLKGTIVSGATYYYPYKYHNRATNTTTPEYLTALRVSEQYLIRAEARAQQGNVPGAVQDLNIIRQRAGLPSLSTALSKSLCLNAIQQEWRIEFFGEWGNRYLDLKRTGRINNVLTAYKASWLPKSIVLPIPSTEITVDPNLKQNAGY